MRWIIITVVSVVMLFSFISGNWGVPSVQAKKKMILRVYQYPHWEGVTGKETEGMSLDDPRRALHKGTDWVNFQARKFLKAYPEVEIKVEFLSWREGRRKVDILIAAGNPPDMLCMEDSSIIMKYARRGLIAPVIEYLTKEDKEDFYQWALDSGRIGDKYYNFPFLTMGNMVLANKLIFDERGMTNLLPNKGDRKWTYDEFLLAAQKTTFDRNGDGRIDVYGIGINFKDGWTDYTKHSFVWGFGAKMFDETGKKFIFNSPEAVKGLQFIKDLQDKYRVLPPGSAALGRDDIVQLWNQGKLAMNSIGFGDSLLALKKGLDQGLIKPGVIEIWPVMYPNDPPHSPVSYSYNDAMAVFKQKDPKKQDILMKFAYFLTSKENAKAPRAMYALSTRKSAADMYKGDPLEDFMSYCVRTAKYAGKDTFNPYYVPLRQFTIPMYQAVLTGEETPKQALDECAKAANEFLRKEFAK
ncbi:hypothetical protein ES703_36163 [subsurface metagenome]